MIDSTQNLKKNSIISTFSLFFQSGYSAFLGLVANLILTIILSPQIFGIYITVLSIIALLNYFSDIGLAASLVQKKEVTDDDIRTTFTIQQIMIISVIIIGYLGTSFIQGFYQLPNAGMHLYWALLISFFLSSLKTIPSVFLERKVQFQKIVLVQVIENTVFYLSVIILASLGFSLTSFTIAVILRSIIGLVLIYSISFWVPQIGISIAALKKLLSFGLPFQTSSFLALFKDDLITLFLGKVLGFESLGYIGWAKKWAEAPIRIIMDNISRVLFPVLSRIQNDKEKISRLMEKIIHYQTLLLAPIMIGMVIVMNVFINVVPKYVKWQPALPLLYLFTFAAFLSSYSTPFINLFNALGKVKLSLAFMIFWTISTWVLTPPLSRLFGFYGFPIMQAILAFSFIAVLHQAKKMVQFSFFRVIYQPIGSSIIMAAFLIIAKLFLANTLSALVLLIALGCLIYLFSIRFLFKIDIISEFKKLFIYE